MEDEKGVRKMPSRAARRSLPMEVLEEEAPSHITNYQITEKLNTKRYLAESDLVQHWPNGEGFSVKWLIENGFSQPMVFHKMDGLDLKIPSDKFTVEDVRSLVGPKRRVDVMDCDTQEPLVLSLQQFVDYYQNKARGRWWTGKKLNVISLEFSHTEMDSLVEPPAVVRELDWVNWAWPSELKKSQTDSTNDMRKMMYPKVQKYCLMSVSDCYTDFHLDFGGTSVWYHILHGEKVFVLVPPSEKNYASFLDWQQLGQQTSIFFADTVPECAVIRIKAGDTLFLPSGWIHSVYTPKHSLVFGGNFLHSLNIQQQLLVAETEKKLRVPKRFLYPFYGQIHWYVVERYLALLGPLCVSCLEVAIDNSDIWRTKFCRKRWLKSVKMTRLSVSHDRRSLGVVSQEVSQQKPTDRQTLHCGHVASFAEVERSGILLLLSKMLAQDAFAGDVPTDITNPMQMVSDLQRIMLCPHLRAPVKETFVAAMVEKENEPRKENGDVLFDGVENAYSQFLHPGVPGEGASVKVQDDEKTLLVQAPCLQDLVRSSLPSGISSITPLTSECEESSSMEMQKVDNLPSPSSTKRHESSNLSSSINTHNSGPAFALMKESTTSSISLPSCGTIDTSSAVTEQPQATGIVLSLADTHGTSPPSSSLAEVVDQSLSLTPSLSDSAHNDHSPAKAGPCKPLSVITQSSLMGTTSSSTTISTGPLLASSPVLLGEHHFPTMINSVPTNLNPSLSLQSPIVPSSSVTSAEDKEPAAKKLQTKPVSTADLKIASAKSVALPQTAKKPSSRRKRRCGYCQACKSVRCGTCRFCLDSPKFGGLGTLKQACVRRRCKNLQMTTLPMSPLSEVRRADIHPADSTTSLSPSTSSGSPFPVPLSQIGTLPYVLITVPEAFMIGSEKLSSSSSPSAEPREVKTLEVDESSKGPTDKSDVIHSAESVVKEQSGPKEELSVRTPSEKPPSEVDFGEQDNIGSDPLISAAIPTVDSCVLQPVSSKLLLSHDAMDISPSTTEALSSPPAMSTTSFTLHLSEDDTSQNCSSTNLL